MPFESGPYAGFADQVIKDFDAIFPKDADVSAVGDTIVKVVDTPFGKRPFRVHIDPTQDGAEVVTAAGVVSGPRCFAGLALGDLLRPRQF